MCADERVCSALCEDELRDEVRHEVLDLARAAEDDAGRFLEAQPRVAG